MQDKVTITASAADRIKFILKDNGNASMLRIGVLGGGCSGFSYTFDFANETNEDDIVFERDDAKVVIDETSIPFLEGCEIDFVNELIGSSFKINNPNATASCGCGTSFSV
ncbi:iron-sulfur cluster insertion protein ErpA [Hirschia baltica]|uniref:Iron-sulfur cluster assembly accessory protein n=1 Tax=Hirschia baltica (strain ATCC 49814 / DSM 5838 / IFAM 1418) TaxID=582402 RepID=C6XIY7_HIRBI|nr:iron-sulfur cluster insertion protein ErpA [Hirschia baltica]ACT59082.1 iron-sulfur cluster assembly accessory protein [Hirschia baltica ATCC 49814]